MSYEQTFRQNNGGYEQLVDTFSGRLYQIIVRIAVRTSR